MANQFTSYVARNVGNSASTLVTVANATQTTLIGMTVANTSNADITASVYITRSAVDYYLVRNASVPVGKTFVPVGGDQKVVLVAGDALKAATSSANSADVIVSVLNIT
jgi:hypothetical protein